MSKLKEITAYEANLKVTSYGDNNVLVYLKSSADKVIVRYKRKRCLAMAKAYHEKSERMYCEASTAKTVNEILGKEPKDAVVEKFELWGAIASTHRKIWLALAEEPTWAKFLQLIHKEAK